VAILPWIGAQELYQKFDFNEAWDGPHNKPLLDEMPVVYSQPGGNDQDPHDTFYQVFVGPGTAFEPLEGGRKLDIPSITDGASNTLAVVEGGQSVPWTKPADLSFDPAGPLPKLGGLFKDGFCAAFVDASVRFVGRGMDQEQQESLLKAFITRNGGEAVRLDQLPQADAMKKSASGEPKKVSGAEPPSMPDDATIRGAIAQIEVARNALRAMEQMRTNGEAVSERDYGDWSTRLMQAKRDFALTRAGKLQALEEHVGRLKSSKDFAHMRYRAGEASLLQYLDAMYRYNEANTLVEKAQEEPIKEPLRKKP
jgi:hypothetical protein